MHTNITNVLSGPIHPPLTLHPGQGHWTPYCISTIHCKYLSYHPSGIRSTPPPRKAFQGGHCSSLSRTVQYHREYSNATMMRRVSRRPLRWCEGAAAENLSNDALPNKATPFFLFSVRCPIFDFVKRFSFWGHHHLHHRTGGRDGREIFSNAKARKLCSSNKKKPSSKLTKLG